MEPTRLPDGARFTCQGCGRCCQGWAVPVDHATVDRLRRHDWGGDPFERTRGSGEPFRIKLVDGRCFFLDENNRCRIHTAISYDAKPPACRTFPLNVLEVGDKRYARLTFWCPTVVANSGKPLEHQLHWVKETGRHADQRTAPLQIDEQTAISPRDFECVHRALRRLVLDSSVPLSDRLGAVSALLRRLQAPGAEHRPRALGDLLSRAEAEGAAALAREARLNGHASGGRRVLTLYLTHDRRSGRLALLGRVVSVVLFRAGLGRLHSRAVGAAATWRQLRRVTFRPAGASDELLTRYFCSKLDGRRYVGGDVTVVAGVNLLVAAYGVIAVLARMRAVSNGRSECNDEDVRAAVGAADLLVVEHPAPYEDGLRKRLATVALGSTNLAGDLLACLEDGW
jgi:Fe-S-cluster containining protein